MARALWGELYEGERGSRGCSAPILPPELLQAEAFNLFVFVLELATKREGDERGASSGMEGEGIIGGVWWQLPQSPWHKTWAWVKEGTDQRGEVMGNPQPSEKMAAQLAWSLGCWALRLKLTLWEGLGAVREQGWMHDNNNKGLRLLWTGPGTSPGSWQPLREKKTWPAWPGSRGKRVVQAQELAWPNGSATGEKTWPRWLCYPSQLSGWRGQEIGCASSWQTSRHGKC